MEEKNDTSHVEDKHENDVENDQPDIEVIDENIEDDSTSNLNQNSTKDLEKKITDLQQEKDDVYDKLVRLQAEYDNFKKRTQKEKQSERKYKSQDQIGRASCRKRVKK